MSKQAVIVGAGGAGLAALHAMQQAGFEVVAFENHDELGGTWALTKYPSLTMHAKSFSYRFHDFPAMASRAEQATGEEVRAYFAAFAKAKQIADKIRYRHRVDRIVRLGDRRCRVFATNLVTGATVQRDCDVVIVATGYSNTGRPHVPAFEGKATSRVRVLHSGAVSQDVLDDIAARRRKVVVLGAGRSAHEILSLLRGQHVTWVYVKSLWSMSFEKLYSDPAREPWNAALYFYYMGIQALRRRMPFGPAMKRLQAPLVRTGYLINPLETDSDVCQNRGAIMKADQLAFLKTLPSIRSAVVGLGERSVVLERGDAIDADDLICATGYDRTADLPALAFETPRGTIEHSLAAQPGFYQYMVDPAVPEVSILSAVILYSQHILGFSLGAQWLARFHQGRLSPQPTTGEMTRWIADRVRRFGRWSDAGYLSNGVPYAHHRDKDVLPHLLAQMRIEKQLARALVLTGTDEQKFGAVCDRVARALG